MNRNLCDRTPAGAALAGRLGLDIGFPQPDELAHIKYALNAIYWVARGNAMLARHSALMAVRTLHMEGAMR